MPWCPVCRFEYRAGMTYCPECDKKLVAELPEQPEPQPGEADYEQVLLCTVQGEMHLSLVQNALLRAGIPSRSLAATDPLLPGFHGVPAAGVSSYHVYVRKGDLKRAAKVYREREGRQ